MERLERTVIQVVEARRLADFKDVAHGRLALLLLDNAAETMLYRRARTALIEAEWYGNALRSLADIQENDNEELRAFREELESKSVSEKTREKIERNFSDLVRFVFTRPDCDLEEELAGCLNALHRYRNDAYHADFVRADVLGPANEIYFYLCCRLLKDQKYMMWPMGDPPAVVAKLLGLDLQRPSGLWDEKSLGDAVADELLARSHLDHKGISSALAAHLTARVGTLDKNLDEFIDYIGLADRSSALRAIQLEPLSGERRVRPEDFWTHPLVVTEKTIQGWARRATSIEKLASAQEALRQFDEIEKAMASFEEQLEPFMIAMDREIQHDIDEMRGK